MNLHLIPVEPIAVLLREDIAAVKTLELILSYWGLRSLHVSVHFLAMIRSLLGEELRED